RKKFDITFSPCVGSLLYSILAKNQLYKYMLFVLFLRKKFDITFSPCVGSLLYSILAKNQLYKYMLFVL
ncbi:hypothetical protein CP988_17975, partial [Enterococcus faecium]